jgi:CO/xanthine dehydrogenase Mo-binding subunit
VDGKLTCWTASQATYLLRKQPAAMLAMPEAGVRRVYVDGSGCYGRNGHEDAAADAALVARRGPAVRVQWMRANEHGWDPKGPPTLIDLHGGLDGDGQPRRDQEPDRGQYRADDDLILTGENS